MHFGASVIEFAGCQRVVLDAPLSLVQSRALTCAAGCQRVILDDPLSRVQSRPISRGRYVSLVRWMAATVTLVYRDTLPQGGGGGGGDGTLQQSIRSFF